MNVVSASRRRAAGASDGVLVQEAAAGSGAAFATLYDRYETPVYNYCLRLLNSEDDAADATQEAFVGILRRLQTDDTPVLDFPAYLFTAARNESYAAMRRRDRSRPAETLPEDPQRAPALEADPERAALMRDAQEEVRAANARLAPRHREVLALREVAGRSYEEIGAVMGISENAAAQLLWRARSRLRDELRLGAVASVAAASEECERAQLLIGMRDDGEELDAVDARWLDEHLEECGSCRASRAMLLEVGASYRAWVPVAALVGLRADVLTSAGHVVGADWTTIAASGRHAGKLSANAGTTAAVGGVATIAAVAVALGVLNNGSGTSEPAAEAAAPPGDPPARAAKAAAARHVKKARPEPVKAAARRALPPVPADAPAAKPPQPVSDMPAAHVAPRSEAPPHKAPPRAPREPGAPAPQPPRPLEPVAEAPPAPPVADCGHPTGAPAGCPPGHGGSPPGQGGVPPGQGQSPPGQARGQQL